MIRLIDLQPSSNPQDWSSSIQHSNLHIRQKGRGYKTTKIFKWPDEIYSKKACKIGENHHFFKAALSVDSQCSP